VYHFYVGNRDAFFALDEQDPSVFSKPKIVGGRFKVDTAVGERERNSEGMWRKT